MNSKNQKDLRKLLFFLIITIIPLCTLHSQNDTKNDGTIVFKEHTIGIPEIISLTLENDSQVKVYTAYSKEKYYTYQSVLAGNLPHINASIGYSPSFSFLPYFYTNGDESDYFTHSIPHKLTYSQMLPTGGNLSVSAANSTGFSINTDSHDLEIYQNPYVSLSYTQPVFINGKIIDLDIYPARIRQSELHYLVSLVNLHTIKNSSIINNLTLFYKILELRMSLGLQKGWLKWEKEKLSHLERRFALKQITDTDVWEMRVDIGFREETILNLEHSLVQAEKTFAFSLGIDDPAALVFTHTIPSLSFTMTKEDLFTNALSRNPQILEYLYYYESARLISILYESNLHNNSPNLSLSFSISPQYPIEREQAEDFLSSFDDFLSEEAGCNWSLSITFNIPIYDGDKTRHNKNAKKALEQVAEDEYYSRIQHTRIQCETIYVHYEHIIEKINLAKDHMELNKKKVEIERKKLEHKKAIDLDVKEAELRLLELENKLWRLHADHFLETCNLYNYAGILLSENL